MLATFSSYIISKLAAFVCSRITIAKCPRWELSPGRWPRKCLIIEVVHGVAIGILSVVVASIYIALSFMIHAISLKIYSSTLVIACV